jgi:hypothetical protein
VTGCTFSGNHATDDVGGMLNWTSSPTVEDCLFTNNSADDDHGGMLNLNSSNPVVTNCMFIGNAAPGADGDGGGMSNVTDCNPTVTDCLFSDNEAGQFGGGMYNWNGCSPTVTDCTFSANLAVGGAGMSNWDSSSPVVTSCVFSANSATGNGGGMHNRNNSSPTVTNCTFSTNSTTNNGGGMHNRNNSSPAVTNCTFSGNSAVTEGGGMRNVVSCSPAVTNCVFWGDTPDEIHDDDSSVPVVTYCDVQGGYPGTGNINADPLFVATAPSGVIRIETDSFPASETPGPSDPITVDATVYRIFAVANTSTTRIGGGLDAAITSTAPFYQDMVGSDVSPTSALFPLLPNVAADTFVTVGNTGPAENVWADTVTGLAPDFLMGSNFIEGSWFNGNPANGHGDAGNYTGFRVPLAQISVLHPFSGFPLSGEVTVWWTIPPFSEWFYTPVAIPAPGTEDDDLRLLPGSPCIDAGDNTAVPGSVTTDLDGRPRFVDDPNCPDCWQLPGTCGDPPLVDMGAYEFQTGCPCDCGMPADGQVNVVDFLALIGDWGGSGPCDCADGGDGTVNVVDFLAMLGAWGSCP